MDDSTPTTKRTSGTTGKRERDREEASTPQPQPPVVVEAAPAPAPAPAPKPPAPAVASNPEAEIRALISTLQSRKVEAEAIRVEAVAEIYRIDKQLASAESALFALSPPLTEVEMQMRSNERIRLDTARRVEAAHRAERTSRSPLDQALGNRKRPVLR